jgi:hypothetical protein
MASKLKQPYDERESRYAIKTIVILWIVNQPVYIYFITSACFERIVYVNGIKQKMFFHQICLFIRTIVIWDSIYQPILFWPIEPNPFRLHWS